MSTSSESSSGETTSSDSSSYESSSSSSSEEEKVKKKLSIDSNKAKESQKVEEQNKIKEKDEKETQKSKNEIDKYSDVNQKEGMKSKEKSKDKLKDEDKENQKEKPKNKDQQEVKPKNTDKSKSRDKKKDKSKDKEKQKDKSKNEDQNKVKPKNEEKADTLKNDEKKKEKAKEEEKRKEKIRRAQTTKVERPKDKQKRIEIEDANKREKKKKHHESKRSSNDSKKSANESNLSEKEIDEQIEKEDAEIEAVYQFNTNPRKNIGSLCAYFHVEETPENIAHIVRTTKGLLGEQIGDYLARRESEPILIAYFMEVDMKCNFIEAMRRSLSGPMFLPGEGQMIDRVMQTFSNCYVQQNPDKYHNPDALYVLAFALIMLNSDQHNPQVTRRMTQKEFVSNTKHSLNCNDISEKDLEGMFDEIHTNPFLFSNQSNDFMALSAPKLRGYLEKKSEHSFSRWTRHYFVLANSCLYYFKDDNPANKEKPLGMIQLTEVEIKGEKRDPLVIHIEATHKQISYVKFKKFPKIVNEIKRITFKAPDRASGARWLHRIKKSAIISLFKAGDADTMQGNYNANEVSDANDESTHL